MIISRSPFRISFAGGGSDLPCFFMKNEGAVISTTIDKFLYIAVHPNFHSDRILLKYNKTEDVKSPENIKNTIASSILSEMKMNGLEIETIGDVPGQTGLGSSSAFAVGLHHVLNAYLGNKLSSEELARRACVTEIDKLKAPIGKQDQYASAYGGLNFYRFFSDGRVVVEPVKIKKHIKQQLDKNLLLFYTGITRSTNTILEKQKNNLKKNIRTNDSTVAMVKLAYRMREALEIGNLKEFGKMLHDGWLLKRSLTSSISSNVIDGFYNLGLANGALGGKLVGAGGGGFLLFYCEQKNQIQLKQALSGLHEVPFCFNEKGSEIIYNIVPTQTIPNHEFLCNTMGVHNPDTL
ncbi:MAG: GHMP kinase [Candidatus Vogelbacteria bacterium]|nr:GHMP kinase [Candidatus Vogelbacteria bacterium]